ncbi:hypothetical protein ACFC0M_01640 [Streptomyces sp. NPDC056149]|uniref:hypothetical protein n=1 Tax=Streptomyces sp. NPDC056149 TaxID=3345728 RepID=UPI0035D7A511
MLSPAVLALGATSLSAAGCVWYLPAAADLRAGPDRPASRRLSAAACLTTWATIALCAPLLLAAAPWRVLGTFTVAGAATALLLAVLARARRTHEQRTTRRAWNTLRIPAPTAGPPSRTRHFLRWFLPGYVVAGGALAAVLIGGMAGR